MTPTETAEQLELGAKIIREWLEWELCKCIDTGREFKPMEGPGAWIQAGPKNTPAAAIAHGNPIRIKPPAEPAFKVGDWVKIEANGAIGQLREIRGEAASFAPDVGWWSFRHLCHLTPEEASTYLRDVILKGRKPHRDDFTLADLKPGMRPGLPKEEFRPLEYEVFQDGRWQSLEYAGWIPHSLSPKIRTTRLLPPLTKTVELTADDVRRAFNQVNQSLKSLENILIEGCARDKMVS